MVRSSGPAAKELPPFLIACETISAEKRDTELSSGDSLWSFRLTIRADGSLVLETVEVNCSAKAVAISVAVKAIAISSAFNNLFIIFLV